MPKTTMAALVFGLTLLGIGPSGAFLFNNPPTYEGPWCVQYNAGPDLVQENCGMPTFEACNIERSRWGSTAFCHQNPRFPGYWGQPDPEPAHRKPRRKRHHY